MFARALGEYYFCTKALVGSLLFAVAMLLHGSPMLATVAMFATFAMWPLSFGYKVPHGGYPSPPAAELPPAPPAHPAAPAAELPPAHPAAPAAWGYPVHGGYPAPPAAPPILLPTPKPAGLHPPIRSKKSSWLDTIDLTAQEAQSQEPTDVETCLITSYLFFFGSIDRPKES